MTRSAPPSRPGIDRRAFLQAGAALTAGYWLGGSVSRVRAAESAQNALNVALIGVGGRGEANVGGLAKQNIVAMCDVDEVRAAQSFDRFPNAKKFTDFRRMFDELGNQIDAVAISTPDHTHFHPAYWAIERGKHVYLEKPMAHSLWEVRELTRLAADKKVATQLGVQRHTLKPLRAAVAIVKSGVLGPIQEVHCWIDSDRGLPKDLPRNGETCPNTLDWDLWLGPAAERPYSKAYCPYNWRFWWDFGTGETGNWGCHILDIPFWALDLKYPTHVSATGATPDETRTPTAMASRLEFPASGSRPAVTLHWSQAKGGPPILKELGLSGKNMNTLFIGAEGKMLCGFDNIELLPAGKFASTLMPPSPADLAKAKSKDKKSPSPRDAQIAKLAESLGPNPGFHSEWVEACRGGAAASCNFGYSGPMAETVLLANLAYRVQGSFAWDAAALKPDSAAAERWIRPVFRKGWEVS